MSASPSPRFRTRGRSCQGRRTAGSNPRRILGVALVLTLAGFGALPRVAEALNEVAMPQLAEVLGGQGSGCRVVDVIDGDTVTLACPAQPEERARLTGFDTPELFSPECSRERESAARAKEHLGDLVLASGDLGVVWHGRDRYGRALVAMSVDGRPVAHDMIKAGLARAYDGGRRDGWCGAEPVTRPGAAAERGPEPGWLELGETLPAQRDATAGALRAGG